MTRKEILKANVLLVEKVKASISEYSSVDKLDSNDVIIYLGAKEDFALKYIKDENFGFTGTRFTYCGCKIYVVDLESYIHVTRRGE